MDINDLIGTRIDGVNGRLDKLQQTYDRAAAAQQEWLRGIKPLRLPLVTGKAVSSALTMGGDNLAGIDASPDTGFVWSLRHLVIEGLTAGATPDVVNILRGGRIIWQLNGNQFAQTWGRGEIILNYGESLTYQSVGTFASTATIIAHGLADNLPAEMQGRLI